MNEQNLKFLEKQLFYSGFGEKLNEALQEKMKMENDFTLKHSEKYGSDSVDATLYIKKSDNSDFFFFNKFSIALHKAGADKPLQQTYYTDKGITLKEGYNLLDGRAVYKMLTTKEDQKYNAWLQLDFNSISQHGNYAIKQFHQNYGFDLQESLARFPIKELEDPLQKEALIKSLQKGNLQMATFNVNGEEKKLFITPSPAFKTIQAYDPHMQRVNVKSLSVKQDPNQHISQETVREELKKKQSHKQAIKPENGQADLSDERKQKHRHKLS